MLLSTEIHEKIKPQLVGLSSNVKLVLFTQEIECQFCRETRLLTEEIVGLSENKLLLETYNFVLDKQKVEEYKIDKIPAIAIVGIKDYGVRFYGIPGGFEFLSFLESIKLVSANNSGLSVTNRDKLKSITEPMKLKVFVTLTRPYCPAAVHTAHQIAIENDYITAEMIESAEFPQLVQKYNVFGVPKTVINDKIEFEGALPENDFVDKVLEAVK